MLNQAVHKATSKIKRVKYRTLINCELTCGFEKKSYSVFFSTDWDTEFDLRFSKLRERQRKFGRFRLNNYGIEIQQK
jgi:hypothetical protein